MRQGEGLYILAESITWNEGRVRPELQHESGYKIIQVVETGIKEATYAITTRIVML